VTSFDPDPHFTYNPADSVPTGSLTVITGSMFSGKTEELIRRVRRALYARRRVQVFKPGVDIRTDETIIRSHSGIPHSAISMESSRELYDSVLGDTHVVAIEEAQFFDSGIVAVCQKLADRGYDVILAGLDTDYRGRPFGAMPQLLAIADNITKLRAICTVCGAEASRSQRLINGNPAPITAPTILIGAAETYEARCRSHHIVPSASDPQVVQERLSLD